MSLFDSLAGMAKGAVTGQGQAGGLDAQGLLTMASQLIEQSGGLQGLVDKLQAGGLGDVVASWVGTGANLPVSAEQLQQALGAETLAQLAQNFGGDPQAVAGGLADILPGLVDQLTPAGQLPADGGADALQALLGDPGGGVADLLGGLFKR